MSEDKLRFVPRYVWISLSCWLVAQGAFEFTLFVRELVLISTGRYL